MKHLFVICAYGDSPFLTECIDSLKQQTDPSEILLCTATPSDKLARLAEDNGLTYCVNPDKPGIATDWNFGLRMARERGADWATLCHQDDLYLPDYGKAMKTAAAAYTDSLIFFTDYGEKRNEAMVTGTKLLTIKKILLLPMRIRPFQKMVFWKRRVLSLGQPICCPSVSFNLNKLPREDLFRTGFPADLDWDCWERLTRLDGRFCYEHKQVLMLHRIHGGSETSRIIGDGKRIKEDYQLFLRFWPAPIAKVITRLYSGAEKSNEI